MLKVCPGSEWPKAFERYPEALGVDHVTSQDEILVWRVLCPRIAHGDSEFCDDARAAEVLD